MIPVLLSLVAIICSHCSNAQSSSCPCLSKSQFVGILQAKGIVHCYNAVNSLTSTGLSDTPTVTITTISQPVDMLLVGNDVYITSYSVRAQIYKLDQNGNQLDVIQLSPSGIRPRFLELHNNKIYVTTIGTEKLVLVSSDINSNNPLVFTTLLSDLPISPNAIRFTPDGNHFLLASQSSNEVYVYNSNDLTNERIISVPSASRTRDIQFDVYGNMYVSTLTNVIKVYSPEYELIRNITYPNTQAVIDNFMFQCDESKILVERNSRSILLIDRDDNIVDTFTFSTLFMDTNGLRTIIITNNGGRTFVNNWVSGHVYLF